MHISCFIFKKLQTLSFICKSHSYYFRKLFLNSLQISCFIFKNFTNCILFENNFRKIFENHFRIIFVYFFKNFTNFIFYLKIIFVKFSKIIFVLFSYIIFNYFANFVFYFQKFYKLCILFENYFRNIFENHFIIFSNILQTSCFIFNNLQYICEY